MNIGVIVGRFQLDEIHDGHKSLILEAAKRSDRLLIVIGYGVLPTTMNNPLSVAQRHQMMLEFVNYHSLENKAVITTLADHPSDEEWSKNLDSLIESIEKDDNVTLYHSRDSFKDYYSGKYPVIELDVLDNHSATLRRKYIGTRSWVADGPAFRRGVIWANQNRYPTVYSCVDGATVRYDESGQGNPKDVLLITKTDHPHYMFPGGFAEIGSSDEEDVIREVLEETGIVAINPEYVGSYIQSQDWRYRSEVDEIRTRLFILTAADSAQEPIASDDAETAQWVSLYDLTIEDFHPCHQELFTHFKKALNS